MIHGKNKIKIILGCLKIGGNMKRRKSIVIVATAFIIILTGRYVVPQVRTLLTVEPGIGCEQPINNQDCVRDGKVEDNKWKCSPVDSTWQKRCKPWT